MLLKAFVKVILILFKIKFKEDGLEADLKENLIIIIIKIALLKIFIIIIIISIKINENLTTFTLLYKTFLFKISNIFF